ncbi:MCM-domain-containing protein [Fragilariopsis cylindrus CCMP1102]|uniref:DNA replication licensing factor MCM3 n=1 Tax=Fragilariopsis cylindrus CCMP1102 TaxID=635003 RepID=A0A1E7EU06_9STRA|nr:MCM-domain-containing protein [Fragilariopsis cylindrus CCMP1102]|eukprot:OEU09319.1 MCM-domain-containing protein [Fragilariopsis cylindrus CCMP1102]
MAATDFASLRDEYDNFLRHERYQYVDRISTVIDDYTHRSKSLSVEGWGCPRVNINMAELRSQGNGGLSQRLRRDPLPHLRALEAACHEIAMESRPGYDKNGIKIKVAFSGPVGAAPMSPRSLTSSCLRQLVSVEGVATKVSAIKPKVVRSVHYCPETKQHLEREYRDATDPELGLHALDAEGRELPDRINGITPTAFPQKDKDGNALETEFGLSEFKDHQTVVLQEMPERAPMGQLPRSIELILDHDLVDKIKPGDRVQIVGVYRALSRGGNNPSGGGGAFKTVVLVNNVQILGRDTSQLTFSPQDVRMIKELGKRPDILSVLGRSLSPSIHGHTVIKRALALQLLSGCEKNLKNGTHLRGDINILMVGDPSTAKSQLLRSAMMIAPLSVSTTGKGSSGVGLTAAVTSDPDTNERRLEAGAMVLADRGLVCVDEFDKMGENDRVAIHEAMEQQTVTIAKAGIHASLNARCSVLAAANPVYGQYDRTRRIQENIGLPDSLLSRFDLLFVVLDQMDPETDRMIANHVIKGHRYRSDHGGAGHDSDYDDDDSDDDMDDGERVHSVWQRNRNDSHVGKYSDKDPHSNDILQHDFLRKFLHFAKTRIKPELTDGAREFIANRYAEMRCRQDERTLPVTARTLETVIRLASAHAKARLSNIVEAKPDCEIAMDVLSFALYHEDGEGQKNNDTDADADQQEVAEVSDEGEGVTHDAPGDVMAPSSKRQRTAEISEQDKLKSRILTELALNDGYLPIDDICQDNEDRDEITKIVETLVSEGKLMTEENDEGTLDVFPVSD